MSLCYLQAGGGEPAADPGGQAVGAEDQGHPGEGAGAETQPAEGHPTPGAAGEAAGVSPGVKTTVTRVKGCTFMYVIRYRERSTHTRNVYEEYGVVMVYNMVYTIPDR